MVQNLHARVQIALCRLFYIIYYTGRAFYSIIVDGIMQNYTTTILGKDRKPYLAYFLFYHKRAA